MNNQLRHPPRLAAGSMVGARYRVRSHLGSGGMGHVYRAEHLGLRREVALKVLHRDTCAAPDLPARFEREARTAARLDHPGCVRVLDSGRSVDGSLFLAMELLSGPTLAQLLDLQQRVTAARAVRIAADLLAALAHAHGQQVMHRDVKPANVVLVTRDGGEHAVLIDFGLARVFDDGPLTAAGICFGSPSYLAPERLLGRASDGRADLYSVGVLLYELLTGVRAFAGATPEETARLQLDHTPRPLRALRPEIPAALEAVVVRALAKRPERRFASAVEMRAALLPPVDPTVTLVLAEIERPPVPLGRRLLGWLRAAG